MISRKRKITAMIVLFALVAIVFVLFWIFWNPGANYQATSTTDDLEQHYDAAIFANGVMARQYHRLDIVLKLVLIFTGVGATVVAALTNAENLNRLKIVTVVLTSVSSVAVGVQSVFHVAENADVLQEMVLSLEASETKYLDARDDTAVAGYNAKRIQTQYFLEFVEIMKTAYRSSPKPGNPPPPGQVKN